MKTKSQLPGWRAAAPAGISLAQAMTRNAPLTGAPGRDTPRQLPADLARILRPEVAPRWRSARVSWFTPQRVEWTLEAGLTGDLVNQWELFDLMEETWPRLAKNLAELKRAVIAMNWRVLPWTEQDKPAPPEAEERARLITHALWRMRPAPAQAESDFRGMLHDLLDAWGKGVSLVELLWEDRDTAELGRLITPRAAQWVHPLNYGVREDGSIGLRPPADSTVQRFNASTSFTDLPPYKFIVATAPARTNHWSAAALLRPLAWWWAAANFSADWLLNYAQLFGVPLRWATHDPNASEETLAAIADQMANMGSAAWAVFPQGTNLQILEGSKQAGSSPQEAILQLADRNCDLLILGQTLTTDPGDRGTQALGTVHERIRGDVIQAAADWLAGTLNRQLIPAILELNYGDTDWAPELKPEPVRVEDQKANAERVATLLNAGVPLPKPWLYEHLDIPLPQPDEETIGGRDTPPDSELQRFNDSTLQRLDDSTEASLAAAARRLALSQTYPSDRVAAAKAKALAEAYRGALAPVREIILRANSKEEAYEALRRFFADWSPQRVAELTEEAFQICAAAGAAAATRKTG